MADGLEATATRGTGDRGRATVADGRHGSELRGGGVEHLRFLGQGTRRATRRGDAGRTASVRRASYVEHRRVGTAPVAIRLRWRSSRRIGPHAVSKSWTLAACEP